jgi:hypothetical protein
MIPAAYCGKNSAINLGSALLSRAAQPLPITNSKSAGSNEKYDKESA